EKDKSGDVDVSDIKATIIKMPKLSDTMKEGTVSKWYKKVGDKIESGEILADIETDKATMEFESFEEGTLLHLAVEEGDSAPVDDVLAVIGEKDADVDKLIKAFKSKGSSPANETAKEETKEETKASSEEKDAVDKKEEVAIEDRKFNS